MIKKIFFYIVLVLEFHWGGQDFSICYDSRVTPNPIGISETEFNSLLRDVKMQYGISSDTDPMQKITIADSIAIKLFQYGPGSSIFSLEKDGLKSFELDGYTYGLVQNGIYMNTRFQYQPAASGISIVTDKKNYFLRIILHRE